MNGDPPNSLHERDSEAPGSPLPLLQFRLRTLLIAVALCSAAFALMAWIGAVWSIVLLFFIALIAGHVAGNAIGTKLRGDRPKRPPPAPKSETTENPCAAAEDPPRLGSMESLHRMASVMTFAGGAGGALAGRIIFSQDDGSQLRTADWVLILVSFAVLGGFVAFLASSFIQVGLWPAAVCFFSRSNPQVELAAEIGDSQE